jgi:predicted kinase
MLHLTVGLPGSGKTTWSKSFCTSKTIYRLSSDDIRFMLYNDPSKITNLEFNLMLICMKELLNLNLDVCIDATLLKESTRDSFIKLAKSINPNIAIFLHVFKTPLEKVLEYNAHRKDKDIVPESVIHSINEKAEFPEPNNNYIIIYHNV